MSHRITAALLAFCVMATTTPTASANNDSEDASLSAAASSLDAKNDIVCLQQMPSADFPAVLPMLHIDVLANDERSGLLYEFTEVVIEEQPVDGHRVEVSPYMFHAPVVGLPNGDFVHKQYAMMFVNKKDVTPFVGTQFRYHLVNTTTGERSESATVLVLPPVW